MTQIPPCLPLRALFDAQYNASRAQVDVPLALRRDRLARLRALIDTHAPALAEAVEADFGVRSPQLTEVAARAERPAPRRLWGVGRPARPRTTW